MPKNKETHLYPPVKDWLQSRGFNVRSEVEDCDIAAVKDDVLVIVELKLNFNLDLVLQGSERKRITEHVFLAVPRPTRQGARWRKVLRLCRTLAVGLLTVSPQGLVEVLCLPYLQLPPRNGRKQRLMMEEFYSRSGDFNCGGSKGRPLLTAYREKALIIAHHLEAQPLSPRQVVELTGIEKGPIILQKNYYSWFDRVERGIYQLSPQGQRALILYADVLKIIVQKD